MGKAMFAFCVTFLVGACLFLTVVSTIEVGRLQGRIDVLEKAKPSTDIVLLERVKGLESSREQQWQINENLIDTDKHHTDALNSHTDAVSRLRRSIDLALRGRFE